MIKITDYMDTKLINLSLVAKDKSNVIAELAHLLQGSSNIIEKTKCYEAIVEREKIGSTGIGKGVAIPHAKTEFATKLTIGFGVSKNGIEFESLDGEKTQIFFVFASPQKESQIYLKIL
ncbi:MAG: PTS sugar transporter subunit IIA, partial [Fusobacteria bacterium]|nr:PTS sugar transporter subunit IIA [Fusobacteriota bacterium]